MENGERRTNYEQQHAAWGQCTNFFSQHTLLLRKIKRNGEPSGDPVTQLHTLHLLVQIRGLRVMENHHDGSYHHGLPGSGVLNKHGDAEA